MKNKSIIISVLALGLIIYSVWSFTDLINVGQNTFLSDTQVMLPPLPEPKHTIITDTSQLKLISRDLSSFWTPNDDEVTLLESIIENAIKENKNEYWKLLDPLTVKKYYRQYVCYTDSNNDSIVYVNAFCNLLMVPTDSSGVGIMKPYDWQNKLMIVDDGGDCFWSIKINMTKMIYFDLMVNGEA